jgi:hypothetical protein
MTETLERLGHTDWGEPPAVISDSTAIEGRGLRCDRPQGRQEIASRLVLETALRDAEMDYLRFLEDDLDFNRHLRHNLSVWEPLADRAVTRRTAPGNSRRCDSACVEAALTVTRNGSCAPPTSWGFPPASARRADRGKSLSQLRINRLPTRVGNVF